MIKRAFDFLIAKQGRTVIMIRRGSPDIIQIGVKVAPSNYFRNTEGPSDTIIKGREFVVSKSTLGTFIPKRGDRIQDADMGEMTISESREMYDFGGSIIGFRLRIQ